MAALIGIPIITFAIILQSTILSQITLLQGPADLVLLIVISWIINERVKAVWAWAIFAGLGVGFVSQLPLWLPLLSYVLITPIGVYIKKRVWQVPVLALFAAVFLGTLLTYLLTYAYLRFFVTFPYEISQVFNLIILPSLLINLIFAIPVQAVIGEIARWFYPAELEPE